MRFGQSASGRHPGGIREEANSGIEGLPPPFRGDLRRNAFAVTYASPVAQEPISAAAYAYAQRHNMQRALTVAGAA